MIKPVYDKDGITLYHAKCEEVLPQLIESGVRVDSVITDPPFGIGFSYGEAHKDGKNDYGEDGYGKWLWSILEQCESLCNPGSPLFVWQAMLNVRKFSEWFPREWRLFASIKNFVQMRDAVMQHSWDPVVCWWTEGDAYVAPKNWIARDYHIANQAVTVTQVWALEKKHNCPRPLDLVRYLVRSFVKPRGVILDCFLGSGTTALSALHEGRKCIGIEKDENFINLAIKRLEDYHGAGFITEVRKQKYKAFKKSKKV